MAKKNVIYVEREAYEKNGNTYFGYFIKGKVRDKEVKVLISPPDIGGYTVLDIVFGNDSKAELVVKPYEMKDASGNIVAGNTYAVRSVDENGEIYECSIKPFRKSDKSLLNMILR